MNFKHFPFEGVERLPLSGKSEEPHSANDYGNKFNFYKLIFATHKQQIIITINKYMQTKENSSRTFIGRSEGGIPFATVAISSFTRRFLI